MRPTWNLKLMVRTLRLSTLSFSEEAYSQKDVRMRVGERIKIFGVMENMCNVKCDEVLYGRVVVPTCDL